MTAGNLCRAQRVPTPMIISVVSTLAAIDWSAELYDLALPNTDRKVAIQWIVCGAVWAVVLWLVRKQRRDARHFVWGIAMMNLAWFGLRMVH